ncbi:GNAT family N-acetyltransferase [Candidatus Shapirobacteria bacterium]|nr:GNAT family N-acetyltransferase [Candidatus Shapirobacteria bacterium]
MKKERHPTPRNIKIRKATIRDAIALRKLRFELVKENPRAYGVVYSTERKKGVDHYARWIKEYCQRDSAMFLLFVKNKLVGMSAIKRDNASIPEVGYVGSLGVLSDYQGKGLGRLLIDCRVEWAKKHTKFKKIKTIISRDNKKMLQIAQKNGFKIVGEGKYYGVPELYLEKEL